MAGSDVLFFFLLRARRRRGEGLTVAALEPSNTKSRSHITGRKAAHALAIKLIDREAGSEATVIDRSRYAFV